jgi:urease accessory protein
MRKDQAMRHLLRIAFVAAPVALCSSPVLAHPGHDAGQTALQGFLHPLSGVDHVLAMLAVGLLAFSLGGRALWTVPLAFVLMMAVGGVLGAAGVELVGVEQGIAASVLVLGVLLVVAARLPLILAVLLAGAFAVFHGAAHGLEGAAGGAVSASYFAGFLAATLGLHCAGIALGAFTALEKNGLLQRATGAALGFAGLMMIIG